MTCKIGKISKIFPEFSYLIMPKLHVAVNQKFYAQNTSRRSTLTRHRVVVSKNCQSTRYDLDVLSCAMIKIYLTILSKMWAVDILQMYFMNVIFSKYVLLYFLFLKYLRFPYYDT